MIRCEQCGSAISPSWAVEINGQSYHYYCANKLRKEMDERTTDALVAAVAMSLYTYNVSAGVRAEKLHAHFSGMSAEPDELLVLVDHHCWATEMAAPTAFWYMQHALDRYGEEAEERVQVKFREC